MPLSPALPPPLYKDISILNLIGAEESLGVVSRFWANITAYFRAEKSEEWFDNTLPIWHIGHAVIWRIETQGSSFY